MLALRACTMPRHYGPADPDFTPDTWRVNLECHVCKTGPVIVGFLAYNAEPEDGPMHAHAYRHEHCHAERMGVLEGPLTTTKRGERF
jgi:hypothetical protein